jgi:hypothetical protein
MAGSAPHNHLAAKVGNCLEVELANFTGEDRTSCKEQQDRSDNSIYGIRDARFGLRIAAAGREDASAQRRGYSSERQAGGLRGKRLSSRNVELEMVPHPQNQDRAEDGNDDAGGVKWSALFRTENQMRDHSADNGTDNPENDRPEKGHVHVHGRFRDDAGDQTNDDVPNEMKHLSSLSDSTPIAEEKKETVSERWPISNCGGLM